MSSGHDHHSNAGHSAHGHGHGHGHGHRHGHRHGHDHAHNHAHNHAHDHTHDHAHDHTHDHAHDHNHDFAAANKAYFDDYAHKGDEAFADWREMARLEVDAMRTRWPALFNKEHTVVLDFACGVGMISEQLVPHVKKIVGVDISQVSVDRYNALATGKLGVAPETMKAVTVELKGQEGELDGVKFDLVVCCASFHHFASIDDTSRLLASFLKPGGALLVADIKAADDGRQLFPETHHGLVPHRHGITASHLRGAFEGAGLGAFFSSFTTRRRRRCRTIRMGRRRRGSSRGA